MFQISIFSLNNLFNYLRPYKKIKNFNNLNLELPLGILIFLIVIKYFTSKRFTIFYIILLALLTFSAYILINQIIIEKYFEMGFLRYNKLFFYDSFKLFFAAFIPFVIFCYLTYIIKLKSVVGFISYILSIFYSAYIAGKLLNEYLFTITFLDESNFQIFSNYVKNDKNIIYFIFLVIFYLISNFLNL